MATKPSGNQDHGPDDPTPDEIRRLCLSIQATWSPLQEYRRRVAHLEYGRSPIHRVPPYEFPRYRGILPDAP